MWPFGKKEIRVKLPLPMNAEQTRQIVVQIGGRDYMIEGWSKSTSLVGSGDISVNFRERVVD